MSSSLTFPQHLRLPFAAQTASCACSGFGHHFSSREAVSVSLTFFQHVQLQVAGAPARVLANLAGAAPAHLAGAPAAALQPAGLQIPPWELSILTLSLQQKSNVKCAAMQPAALQGAPCKLSSFTLSLQQKSRCEEH